MRKRRNFLKGIGALGAAGVVAGCSGDNSGDGGSGSSDGSGADGSSDGSSSDGESMDTETETDTPSGPEVTFGGNEELNFNLSPSVPQEDLYVQYAPLRDHLEEYITNNFDVPDALDAQMNVGSNYSAVIQALGQGTADLAETGPFAAAIGYQTDNSDIILQRYGYGGWTYKSIIATRNDSDISEVADLEGRSVAFSDPLSTSGFLYPTAAIQDAGIDVGNLPEGNGSQASFDPTFAGGHVQSYTLLEQGQVDAAAMGGFVRDTKTGPTPDDWQSVATTLHEDEGLPRAPIVVSSALDDDAQNAIQEAFLQASDTVFDGADAEDGTDDDLWFSKVREADVETYQGVLDVAESLGVGADFFGN
ncbi:phosphate/phosphite/phosphonate ABC transporter substrate-binding protein [Halomicroarcula sp. GCM10025709]|uniref:phosphate/phosphite/phosphonate ABC transporter substrate-binding protein n=1 Tax=Haloarcula TaxID=2237 RepID=UPI0024C3AFA4|nr:phosphate/phosphite/phosphonate ABC transporter substrate-binding protein [Halomicroarcula sp. YJ-61-S]